MWVEPAAALGSCSPVAAAALLGALRSLSSPRGEKRFLLEITEQFTNKGRRQRDGRIIYFKKYMYILFM